MQRINELDELPSFEKYKSNLQNLKNISHLENNLVEIEKYYFKNAIIFPGNTAIYEKNDFKNFTPFRVRTNVGDHEDISNPLTFSMPPIENTPFGRGNIKGHPVFYCSHNPAVAIRESKMPDESIGYCGKWKISKDITSFKASVIIPRSVRSENLLFGLGQKIHSEMINQMGKSNEIHIEHLEYLQQFLYEIFGEEPTPYVLSSWISHKLLYERNHDFIVYSSYESQGLGSNFVFSPTFANTLKLDSIMEFRKTPNEENKIGMDPLKFGRINEGKIKWEPIDDVNFEIIKGWSGIR